MRGQNKLSQKPNIPDFWQALGLTNKYVVHELSQHVEMNLAMFCESIVNKTMCVECFQLGMYIEEINGWHMD